MSPGWSRGLIIPLALLAQAPVCSQTEPIADGEITLQFESDDPYQVLFLIAIGELARANYALAIKLLQSLYQRSATNRIRLELARALYLDRRYREAKGHFQALYEDAGIPLSVRENVKLYLDEIDAALGDIRFSFSIINDPNPLNFTDAQRVLIAGRPFLVVPPVENKAVIGAELGINAAKALNDDASISVYLNTGFMNYEGGRFDRLDADGGVLLAPKWLPKYRAKLGFEDAIYGGSNLYGMPYLSFIYIPDPVNRFRWTSELKYGRLDVSDSTYLDADYLALAVKGARRFRKDLWLTAWVFLEGAETDERSYSYKGAAVGSEVSVPLSSRWGVRAQASFGGRRYGDRDPLFGSTRRDASYSIGVSLFSRRIKFLGYEPELGVRLERRDSNLDYFDYDKTSLIFRLTE